MRNPCYTCHSVSWGAKNNDFCTDCEDRWYRELKQCFLGLEGENPKQSWVDSIIDGVQYVQKNL